MYVTLSTVGSLYGNLHCLCVHDYSNNVCKDLFARIITLKNTLVLPSVAFLLCFFCVSVYLNFVQKYYVTGTDYCAFSDFRFELYIS